MTCSCSDGVHGDITGFSYLHLVFTLDSRHLPDHAEEENLRDDWERDDHPSESKRIKTLIKVCALIIPEQGIENDGLVQKPVYRIA